MGLYDEYGTCLSIDLFGGIPYVISGIRFQSLSIYLYMYEYTWFGRRTNVHGFMDSCGMDSLTFWRWILDPVEISFRKSVYGTFRVVRKVVFRIHY
jgi:hypothetical protein